MVDRLVAFYEAVLSYFFEYRGSRIVFHLVDEKVPSLEMRRLFEYQGSRLFFVFVNDNSVLESRDVVSS